MHSTTIRATFLVLATLAIGCADEGATAYLDGNGNGPEKGGGIEPVVATSRATPDAGPAVSSQDTRPAPSTGGTVAVRSRPDASPAIAADTLPQLAQADARPGDAMVAVDSRAATLPPDAKVATVNPRDISGGKAVNDAGWSGFAAGGLCPSWATNADGTQRCIPQPIEPWCDPSKAAGCLPASQYPRCLIACP